MLIFLASHTDAPRPMHSVELRPWDAVGSNRLGVRQQQTSEPLSCMGYGAGSSQPSPCHAPFCRAPAPGRSSPRPFARKPRPARVRPGLRMDSGIQTHNHPHNRSCLTHGDDP
jgi:hypothetical protein